MKTAIICCENLKYELIKTLKKSGSSIPVIWISSDYHINSDRLREKLQQEIDQLQDFEKILLGFGCCGNSVIGLTATTADLVIPKAHDCIEILLSRRNKKFKRRASTYFLSKGWLQSDKGIIQEHKRLVERYGEVKAKNILKIMLNQYYSLMFIDSGVSDKAELDRLLKTSEQFAAAANLELMVEKGGYWLLKALVQGLFEKDFIIIKKGETVPMTAFMSSG
ncbi:MAG: DUF1638 domain-containing protein [Peptococcaceae bacterium]|nr:DUF1638 domain-containing protein [Peptococcaceae bacterium]